VNLGRPDEFTILEAARLVARVAGVPLVTERRPLPQDDPARRCPDITLARKLLGWEPRVDLRDGLERTIAWWRERPELTSAS
jgi:nucleoside-diphosphate-sugar epimerase